MMKGLQNNFSGVAGKEKGKKNHFIEKKISLWKGEK